MGGEVGEILCIRKLDTKFCYIGILYICWCSKGRGGRNSANTITIHNTWFQCPQELPHSSATSQPPALPQSITLMLGGREGGQVRVGSGLCQGSAGDPEGILQGGEARHKWGVGGGGGGFSKEDGVGAAASLSVLGPAHSPTHPPKPCLPTSSPSPETLLHGSYTNGHITKWHNTVSQYPWLGLFFFFSLFQLFFFYTMYNSF